MLTKYEITNFILLGISLFMYHEGRVKMQTFYDILGTFFLIGAIIMYLYGLATRKDDWMKKYKKDDE